MYFIILLALLVVLISYERNVIYLFECVFAVCTLFVVFSVTTFIRTHETKYIPVPVFEVHYGTYQTLVSAPRHYRILTDVADIKEVQGSTNMFLKTKYNVWGGVLTQKLTWETLETPQ